MMMLYHLLLVVIIPKEHDLESKLVKKMGHAQKKKKDFIAFIFTLAQCCRLIPTTRRIR